MTSPKRISIVAFAWIAAAVLVIVVLWVYPGFLAKTSSCPGTVMQGNTAYCAETIELPTPQITPPTNYTGPLVVTDFLGFIFALHFVWTPLSYPSPAWLTGWMHEPNETNYSVRLAVPEFARGANWTSPDSEAIVDWLAVVTMPDGAQYNSWNVTLGVEKA